MRLAFESSLTANRLPLTALGVIFKVEIEVVFLVNLLCQVEAKVKVIYVVKLSSQIEVKVIRFEVQGAKC